MEIDLQFGLGNMFFVYFVFLVFIVVVIYFLAVRQRKVNGCLQNSSLKLYV